jgi:two-component system chemotaxis response regulator CheB
MDCSAASPLRRLWTGGRDAPAAIGVCASTGGPRALALLLAELPASYPIPVLVVQHIAGASHTERLVEWLDGEVSVPVRLARNGARLAAGAWVAPAGAHLRLAGRRRLELAAPEGSSSHVPSGDVLLGSLAATFGREAAAVVLTGMGSDGAEGLGRVAGRGGLALAQDEASSVVFGMPKAAIAHGAQLVLDPASIGSYLAAFAPTAARPVGPDGQARLFSSGLTPA